MTAQESLNKYIGQSLLYNKSIPSLIGQCVQYVCFYVADNGKPVIWKDAYQWWSSGLYPEAYDRIPNSTNAIPQPGDIIIWSPALPNSGGAGHIAVCLEPRPGTGTFVSIEQNWGGKTIHKVTHNYDYVIGWLRFKDASPTPQIKTEGPEMIANNDQAIKIYKMLRPNSGGSEAEINGTAGHRSFEEFLNSAQTEIAQRDANIRAMNDQNVNMGNTINKLNETITKLTTDDKNDKQAIADGLNKIGDLTAQLSTTHDKIVDLQATPEVQDSPSLLVKILALFIKKK